MLAAQAYQRFSEKVLTTLKIYPKKSNIAKKKIAYCMDGLPSRQFIGLDLLTISCIPVLMA